MNQQQRSPAGSQEEDLVLIQRVADGDRSALTGLYERHSSTMLGLGVRLLRRRDEAEDLLHEVFLEAWRKARSYDATRGTVRSWLLLRMRSRALDRLKSPRLARATALDESAERKLVDDRAPAARLGTEQRALAEALEALPEEQRSALSLVYFDGLTVAEAAERLGAPSGTIKSRMSAARKTLRAALASSGVTG
jgi:RNA polymerase sigma-70 factor (ECF subfamily)